MTFGHPVAGRGYLRLKMPETDPEPFLARSGWADARRAPMKGDASSRRYSRLTRSDGASAILMQFPADLRDSADNFVRIGTCLARQGVTTPRIMAQDADQGYYLISDLGDIRLADLAAKDAETERNLYLAATRLIPVMQRVGNCGDLPDFGFAGMIQAAALVCAWYPPARLDPAGITTALTDITQRLPDHPLVFVHRDYHAENLMVGDNAGPGEPPGVIDFQDAVMGHPLYDLVSLLADARRDVPTGVQTACKAHFLERRPDLEPDFDQSFAVLTVLRNLRILGVFARLGRGMGKTGYVRHIPRVWRDLVLALDHPGLADLRHAVRSALPEPDPATLKRLETRCPLPPAA